MWLEYRMLVAMYLVDFVGEYVCGSHRDLPIDVELLDFTWKFRLKRSGCRQRQPAHVPSIPGHRRRLLIGDNTRLAKTFSQITKR